MISMSKLLFCFVWLVLLTRIYSQNTYKDLKTIHVCSITFPYGSVDFTGDYVQTHVAGTGPVLPINFEETGGNGREFKWDSAQRAFAFYYPNHGTYNDVYVRLKNEGKMRELFHKLWEKVDPTTLVSSCSCGSNSVIVSDWETTGSQGTPGNPTEVELCGEWKEVNGVDWDNWGTSGPFYPADAWNCVDNSCSEETRRRLTIKYQGFEVFTDTDKCIYSRRKVRSRDGDWRCELCNNGVFKDGEFAFRIENEFNPPDGQGQHKCYDCQEIFGPSCKRCDRYQGCSACTFDAFQNGSQIINKGDDGCPWQYCGQPCCNEDIITPAPLSNCDDPHPIQTPAYAHGFTNFICNDERLTSSYYNTYYTLPLPIEDDNNVCNSGTLDECLGDCSNGVPYRCFDILTDPNCVVCNDAQPFDLRGCKICAQDYFWYSNAVPCVPCSDIWNCDTCQNGTEHGGGGCDVCAAGYTKRYDDKVGVYFCTDDTNTIANAPLGPPSVPGIDGWDGLKCVEEYERRAGRHKYAFCGCNCTDCDLGNISPGTTPENPYCLSCHFHGGCAQCNAKNLNSAEDWFMPSMFHKCVNCRDTFGERCMDCGFEVGCQQCQDEYELTYSDCCDLQYCEYKSRFV